MTLRYISMLQNSFSSMDFLVQLENVISNFQKNIWEIPDFGAKAPSPDWLKLRSYWKDLVGLDELQGAGNGSRPTALGQLPGFFARMVIEALDYGPNFIGSFGTDLRRRVHHHGNGGF
jgi:hypothetical protein